MKRQSPPCPREASPSSPLLLLLPQRVREREERGEERDSMHAPCHAAYKKRKDKAGNATMQHVKCNGMAHCMPPPPR